MVERRSQLKMSIWTSIFVSGVGISAIGDFIYLVAINVFVLNETHSPSAVAGLWVVPRIAALIVGPWVGSITDRFSRKNQLVVIEFFRAVLLVILPLLSHLIAIYAILFLLGVGSTFFNSLFLPYQTLLIPDESRKRINSIVSTLRYSALIIGPAIAGILLTRGNAKVPLWFDAVSFLASASSFILLPNLGLRESSSSQRKHPRRIFLTDWRTAFEFLAQNRLFTVLFSLNALFGIFALTADTQEVVFAREALHLGQLGYGMMVTSAGIGYISGSLILSIFARRINTVWLLSVGILVSALGYLTYALSQSFWWAVIGLIILGVFGSCANVGMTTYTQRVMPTSHMGRITSVTGPPQALLNVVFVLLAGLVTTWLGVRDVMVSMTIMMSLSALLIAVVVLLPRNQAMVTDAPASHVS